MNVMFVCGGSCGVGRNISCGKSGGEGGRASRTRCDELYSSIWRHDGQVLAVGTKGANDSFQSHTGEHIGRRKCQKRGSLRGVAWVGGGSGWVVERSNE